MLTRSSNGKREADEQEPAAVKKPKVDKSVNKSESPAEVTKLESEEQKEVAVKETIVADSKPVYTGKVEFEPAKDKTESSEPVSDYKWPSKKRYAVFMGFCGDGYKGMMRNPNVKSIEDDLVKAMKTVKLIRSENIDDMKKMHFQRASRTDKGVSAARQVCSLDMHMHDKSVLKELNDQLPPEIIVYDILKTTKSFDCQKMTSSRTYEYLLPSFAFAPAFADTWEGYRIPEGMLDQINSFLKEFHGTKNHFNYTSGRKVDDPSCFRHIRELVCTGPWIENGLEWLRITINGDSFMYHQIRKIVGMTIAVMRKAAPENHLLNSFAKNRIDVPRAPGLGLILDEVKLGRYNKKFGEDGVHTPLIWTPYEEKVDKFKKEHIYSVIFAQEKSTKSMLNWLGTLSCHTFYQGDVLPACLTAKSSEELGTDKPTDDSGADKAEVPDAMSEKTEEAPSKPKQGFFTYRNHTESLVAPTQVEVDTPSSTMVLDL